MFSKLNINVSDENKYCFVSSSVFGHNSEKVHLVYAPECHEGTASGYATKPICNLPSAEKYRVSLKGKECYSNLEAIEEIKNLKLRYDICGDCASKLVSS